MNCQQELQSAAETNALVNALVESPSLLVFIIPWTAAAIQALGYTQCAILFSFAHVWTLSALFVSLIGFLLTIPWMLLAVASLLAACKAIRKLYELQSGLRSLLVDSKKKLDLCILKDRTVLTKLFAAVAAWSVISLPFTLLNISLLKENKLAIALFLSALLTPYWLLALVAIYLIIIACTRHCRSHVIKYTSLELAVVDNLDSG